MEKFTTYQDEVISFLVLPDYKMVERSTPYDWCMKKRGASLYSLAIRSSSEVQYHKATLIDSTYVAPFYTLIPAQQIETAIGTLHYGGTIRSVGKAWSKYLACVVFFEKYGYYMTIRENKEFDIQKYVPFFNSIVLNEEEYFRQKELFVN